MAGWFERNGKDGKPTPSNLPARETIGCPQEGCEVSYTISYTDEEDYVSGSERNVDKMRRIATAIAKGDHPTHITKNYKWMGPERGWLEADSLAARKAL